MKRRSPARSMLAVYAAGVLALGLYSGVAASSFGGSAGRAAGRGSVSALFAGSLVDYMEGDFGPSFEQATGYGFRGYGGGSTELAAEIKGGVRQGDVFLSAAAGADRALEGSAKGNWVSWYTTFAASPLVLAYNPQSKFGAELAHGEPWHEVLTQPGILVGRTDPVLDPKGVLTVEAVDNAAEKLHAPALAAALKGFPVYPETALVGRLQSGQLDAGFFYAVEASASHLKTVGLEPVYKYANYTVTILNHSSSAAGAAALIGYLLGSQRSYTLKRNGLTLLKPRFSGDAAAVPKRLRKLVGAS
jgi:molybdate/tungstate transport system substrate-binding protein